MVESTQQAVPEYTKDAFQFNSMNSELMKAMYPNRNTFKFDNIVITSDFESGNLLKCQPSNFQSLPSADPNSNESIRIMPQTDVTVTGNVNGGRNGTVRFDKIKDDVYGFDCWISPDSEPYVQNCKQKAQFLFSVTGVSGKNPSQPEKQQILKFRFVNMSNQSKLLSYGHKPVAVELTRSQFNDVVQGQIPMFDQKWKRIAAEVDCIKLEEGVAMTFQYTLPESHTAKDHIMFAYAQPFTYTDVGITMHEFQMKCQANSNIYFHREVLVKSLEGRPVELFTVTAKNKKTQPEQRQSVLGVKASQEPGYKEDEDVLYPNGQDSRLRPLKFEKPTIFLTSRVHCGETQASFFLLGMMDLLTNFQNIQSHVLLENFVFKIIPILNPDGVVRGYWRNDTQGLNLNRFYQSPDPYIHPTIYGTKKAILKEYQDGKLHIYTDLHGHCTKRGCFVFGNTFKNAAMQAQQILLPKLISLNSVNFDLRECNFKDEENNKKDKKGDSREGSGRATIFRETNQLPYCFTLEGNYCTGIRVNTLQARFDSVSGKRLIKEDNPIHDTSSSFYRIRKIPIYNGEVFRDVGRAYLVAILDLYAINPQSRLIRKSNESLQEAVQKIKDDLVKSFSKPSLKSFKRKGTKTKKDFELVMKNDNEIE